MLLPVVAAFGLLGHVGAIFLFNRFYFNKKIASLVFVFFVPLLCCKREDGKDHDNDDDNDDDDGDDCNDFNHHE